MKKIVLLDTVLKMEQVHSANVCCKVTASQYKFKESHQDYILVLVRPDDDGERHDHVYFHYKAAIATEVIARLKEDPGSTIWFFYDGTTMGWYSVDFDFKKIKDTWYLSDPEMMRISENDVLKYQDGSIINAVRQTL